MPLARALAAGARHRVAALSGEAIPVIPAGALAAAPGVAALSTAAVGAVAAVRRGAHTVAAPSAAALGVRRAARLAPLQSQIAALSRQAIVVAPATVRAPVALTALADAAVAVITAAPAHAELAAAPLTAPAVLVNPAAGLALARLGVATLTGEAVVVAPAAGLAAMPDTAAPAPAVDISTTVAGYALRVAAPLARATLGVRRAAGLTALRQLIAALTGEAVVVASAALDASVPFTALPLAAVARVAAAPADADLVTAPLTRATLVIGRATVVGALPRNRITAAPGRAVLIAPTTAHAPIVHTARSRPTVAILTAVARDALPKPPVTITIAVSIYVGVAIAIAIAVFIATNNAQRRQEQQERKYSNIFHIARHSSALLERHESTRSAHHDSIA